jgi:hypothetical protein
VSSNWLSGCGPDWHVLPSVIGGPGEARFPPPCVRTVHLYVQNRLEALLYQLLAHASVQRIFDGEKEANPEGADAYPITTFTWLLFYRQQDAKKAEVFLKLVEWCATEGQAMSDSLGYIPLPAAVVAKIKIAADRIQ